MGAAESTAPVGYLVSTWPRLSQTFVLNEVLALERRGLALRIFSAKDPGDEPVHGDVAKVRAPVRYLALHGRRRQVLLAGARVAWRHPGRYCRTAVGALRYHRWGIMRRFFQACYLADILDQEPVVHLHAHFATAPALIAMFTHNLTGIPYTFTAHARDIYVDTRPKLLREEVRRAQAVVAVSAYTRTHLETHFALSGQSNVLTIYNGLDLDSFPFCSPSNRSADSPTVLFVGRLVEKKGCLDLIRAMKLIQGGHQPTRLDIIGSGPLREHLEYEVARLDLRERVRFLGAQSQEVIRRYYIQATVFALPCVIAHDGDRDGIPTVLLEAMASGLPVISTHVAGIPELIESGRDGILVASGDPSELTKVLSLLLGCGSLRTKLALAARETIETRFAIDDNVRRLESLFRSRTVK